MSSCGASRAPTNAPTTMPATESALAMSPFLQSEQCRQGDEGEREPVDLGHRIQATGRLGAPGYNGRRYAGA